MLMICLEWTGFEIAAFVLGSISEAELAVNTIIINMFIIVFMVSGLAPMNNINVHFRYPWEYQWEVVFVSVMN